jgi:tryptophanase
MEYPSCSHQADTLFISMPALSYRRFRWTSSPGVALANELYIEGGLRSVEIGRLMFADAAKWDLVRLATPRRVYTQSHIDYGIGVILEVWKRREQVHGLRITSEAPFLRHFTAQLEPLVPVETRA